MQSTESPPSGSRFSDAADWTRSYWQDHPKRSLETFGRQITMGFAAVAELFVCSLLPSSVNDALGTTLQVTADFDNIAGIYEGNPITVLGLDVGKVDKIVPKGTL
ncbi:MlaD family protein, partial [Nocardia asiatica]